MRPSLHLLGLLLLGSALSCALGGCSPQPPAPAGAAVTAAGADVELRSAFDALLDSGPLASEEEISANAWASAVRQAGVLRVGGTRTSLLFSQYDERDGQLRGFDAGIYRLLARYILGDAGRFTLTQIDSATREAVLQNGQVDAVVATYSITDRRRAVVDFAGPYYTSRQAILVRRGMEQISSPQDLAGQRVAAQKGSTGPGILQEAAPQAHIELFANDTEARTALSQGRVAAYVTDQTLLLSAVIRAPETFALAGAPFGPEDRYGIGLPRNSQAAPFVNAFLRKIIAQGLWQQLWQTTIGRRAGLDSAPQPPQPEP